MKYLLLLLFPFTLFSQQLDIVDFTKIEAAVIPDATSKAVTGSITVHFTILKNTNKVYLDAINMDHTADIKTMPKGIDVVFTEDKIWLHGNYTAGNLYTVTFHYTATPKQTLYFTGNQIWTQGQGKYTSHWLPSINDMNDKIEFDLSIQSSEAQQVIANGVLVKKEKVVNSAVKVADVKTSSTKKNAASTSLKRLWWHFNMEQPMSSYLVAFALGNFKQQRFLSASNIPIHLYINESDTAKFEPTYRYTKEIFDFLETEISIPYPWQDYKQVPVRDFLYAGMENTGCTIFSEAFVVDSIGFNDRNYVNVNAHELAHQWFGNLVTETSGDHHWLHEGFATYYALLAEREIFGEDYYYWKLFTSAESLQQLSDQGKGESLLNPNASSLTFYEKGAWALHILRELIGDLPFRNAVTDYVTKHQYKNVTTQDFLQSVRANTTVNIDAWEEDWLQQSAFKATQAYESLITSTFINNYLEIAAMRPQDFESKKNAFIRALTFPNDYIAQEVVNQLMLEPLNIALPLLKQAFETNNVYVRQALAIAINDTIPEPLLADYTSLLKDPSYITQEAAMYTLWLHYRTTNPSKILNTMDGVVGFQNKNVRQLWLVLSIISAIENDIEAFAYKEELASYTSTEFSFEVRQLAFNYINDLNMWNDTIVKNLLDATQHHNWRFRDAARALLESNVTNTLFAEIITTMYKDLTAVQKAYIKDKGFKISE